MRDTGWWKKTPSQPGWSSGAAPTAAGEMGQWDTALGKHPTGHGGITHSGITHRGITNTAQGVWRRAFADRMPGAHTKAVSLSPN